MGKGILLMVLASSITLAIMRASEQQARLETEALEGSYKTKVLARELAYSAFNLLVANTSRDFSNYRGVVSDQAYSDGAMAYAATGNAEGPITLIAYGRQGSAIHQISATMVKSGETVLDAITFDGPFSSVRAIGSSFLISGLDVPANDDDQDGGDGPNGHAILTTLESARDDLLGEIDESQLIGIEGFGDIATADPTIDLDSLQQSILNHPDLITLQGDQRITGNDSFGSRENPVLISVTGDLTITGTVTGYGVLLVEGSFYTQGTLRWEGLVMISSAGGESEFKGTIDIYGALIVRSLTPSGESGGYDDAGLSGGHFDVDVFDWSGRVTYHEHQYDDRFGVTSLNYVSDGCGTGGGLCWENNLASMDTDRIRVELTSTNYSGGSVLFRTTALHLEGTIGNGFSRDLDPASLTQFSVEFDEICDIDGSSPEMVQSDEANRSGVLTMKVFDIEPEDMGLDAQLLHEVSIYRHSGASSCFGSDEARIDVLPQSFYINGHVAIHKSASALNSIMDLLPSVESPPAEIKLISMRQESYVIKGL